MDARRILLERLLRKYESSAHYRGNGSMQRRIFLRFGPRSRDVPEYLAEDIDARDAFHEAAQDLAHRGLIGFEWERDSDRTVLSRMWLATTRIDSVYNAAGEPTKANRVAEAIRMIDAAIRSLSSIAQPPDIGAPDDASNAFWIHSALADARERMVRTKCITPALPDDESLANDLIAALLELARPDFQDMSQRVFSVRLFKDSKHFERKVRSRLLPILRRFGPSSETVDEEWNDDDRLAAVGLFRNPEILEFCGPIRLQFKEGTLDTSLLTRGATLNSASVHLLRSIDASRIRHALFIENRTSYDDWIQKHHLSASSTELVLFHGGFLSRSRRRFFQLIAKALLPDCPVEHWGDIDLGGIAILHNLRKALAPVKVHPMRMDRDTLHSMKDRGVRFDVMYRNRIEKLLESPTEPWEQDEVDLLRGLLEEGVRIEQEAFAE